MIHTESIVNLIGLGGFFNAFISTKSDIFNVFNAFIAASNYGSASLNLS